MRATMTGLLMIAGLATGCASGPDIRTTATGAPPAATAFSLLGDTDPAAAAGVETELQRRGWRVVERDAPWRIEVLRTHRNERAGAFTTELRPGADEAWTIQPARRRWWRREGDERGLALALLNSATGERVARGEAWTRRPAGKVSDDRLTAAAVEALLTADAARQPEAR